MYLFSSCRTSAAALKKVCEAQCLKITAAEERDVLELELIKESVETFLWSGTTVGCTEVGRG